MDKSNGEKSKNNQSNYYDHIAPIYDETRWMTTAIAEDVADFVVNLVGATPTTSFLEPGVGTGLNVLPLVKRGYAVTGIDISEQMLDRFRQKFSVLPFNLTLLREDASQLPFPNNSFNVVLTVHMVHTVADWQVFLDEVDRVLKPEGFYLNAQWITPPARMEFEGYFRGILAKYSDLQRSKLAAKNINQNLTNQNLINQNLTTIDVDGYFRNKGYGCGYAIAKRWMVRNTVAELLEFYQKRAYGFCWQVSDEIFEQAIAEFQKFCLDYYGSLQTELASEAKFEIWSYR